MVECPRCYLDAASRGRAPGAPQWRATGQFTVNARGRRRAVLACPVCGDTFASGAAEALAAGAEAAATLPPDLPWLPDFKKRAGGDDEPET